MINQQQLTRLVREFKREGNLTMSAMKAGMDPKTARKYVRSGAVVLAARGPRTWRTRTDPLGAAWALAEGYLRAAPELEARALFEHLLETAGEAIQAASFRKLTIRAHVSAAPLKPVRKKSVKDKRTAIRAHVSAAPLKLPCAWLRFLPHQLPSALM